MSKRDFTSIEEQIEKLKSKGLNFDALSPEEYNLFKRRLLEIGYKRFIKTYRNIVPEEEFANISPLLFNELYNLENELLSLFSVKVLNSEKKIKHVTLFHLLSKYKLLKIKSDNPELQCLKESESGCWFKNRELKKKFNIDQFYILTSGYFDCVKRQYCYSENIYETIDRNAQFLYNEFKDLYRKRTVAIEDVPIWEIANTWSFGTFLKFFKALLPVHQMYLINRLFANGNIFKVSTYEKKKSYKHQEPRILEGISFINALIVFRNVIMHGNSLVEFNYEEIINERGNPIKQFKDQSSIVFKYNIKDITYIIDSLNYGCEDDLYSKVLDTFNNFYERLNMYTTDKQTYETIKKLLKIQTSF